MQYLRRHWSEMYRRHRPEHQTVPRIYPQRLVGRTGAASAATLP
ncbi:hypothetical protein NXV13_10025 [Bacteroides ovatus]|nr:hypothetical protein [Bacteroides ovatus]